MPKSCAISPLKPMISFKTSQELPRNVQEDPPSLVAKPKPRPSAQASLWEVFPQITLEQMAMAQNSHPEIHITFLTFPTKKAGCWLTYPSEKYESQLGWLLPIYGKTKNVPNHQPGGHMGSATLLHCYTRHCSSALNDIAVDDGHFHARIEMWLLWKFPCHEAMDVSFSGVHLCPVWRAWSTVCTVKSGNSCKGSGKMSETTNSTIKQGWWNGS